VKANKQAKNIEFSLDSKELSKGFTVSFFTTTRVDSVSVQKLVLMLHVTASQVNSVLNASNIQSTHLNTKIVQTLVQLQRKEVSAEEIVHTFLSTINKVLFALLPLFAFFVWLWVNPKKLFYTEALIFSVYFHALYFILMLFAVLVNFVAAIPIIYLIMYVLACIYLVRSFKQAFDLTLFAALGKSLGLVILYTFVFAFVFVAAFVSSFIS
jgi:hypothetical protein